MPRPILTHDSDTVTVAIPRSALVVVEQARYISRENCTSTFGFDPPGFQRRIIPALRASGVRVHRVGHLSLVAADDLAAWLATRTETPAPVPPARPVDTLADELGLHVERH